MQKFCTKCGGKLDENTGKCPNCDRVATGNGAKTAQDVKVQSPLAENKKRKSGKLGMRILLIVLSVIIVAAGTTCVLQYFGVINIPMLGFIGGKAKTIDAGKDTTGKPEKVDKGDEDEDEDDEVPDIGRYTVDRIDADEYYNENADVLSTEKASKSDSLLSESEVFELLEERGFSDVTATTNYLKSGEYIMNKEISPDSSEKHPMYSMLFRTENGEIWSIIIVGDNITACPIYYNSNLEKSDQTVLSETDYIISYDSGENKFYTVIPHEDVLTLKKIERIDADTLEGLTEGDIEEL